MPSLAVKLNPSPATKAETWAITTLEDACSVVSVGWVGSTDSTGFASSFVWLVVGSWLEPVTALAHAAITNEKKLKTPNLKIFLLFFAIIQPFS